MSCRAVKLFPIKRMFNSSAVELTVDETIRSVIAILKIINRVSFWYILLSLSEAFVCIAIQLNIVAASGSSSLSSQKEYWLANLFHRECCVGS